MPTDATALLLVGAGKMGGALLEGWLRDGAQDLTISIQEPYPSDRLRELADAGRVTLGAPPSGVALIVLAVKPQMMGAVLPGLAPLVEDGAAVLSIAAGTTMAELAAAFGDGAALIRAMPNTPAAVGRGITVATANAQATDEICALARRLLEAVGEVAWIEDESLMDAVTAISGSGPAYVFLFTECLAEAAEELGLAPDLAARLARATVAGAGELLYRDEADAGDLRERVTSPGGTTAAALGVLMTEPGLAELVRRAARAARDRGRELGQKDVG